MDSRYKLKTGEEVAYFPPIQNTDSPYATEAAMHADQSNQLEGYGYLVDGVGAFTYLGTLSGTAADYEAFGGVNTLMNVNVTPFITKWNAVAGVPLLMPIRPEDVGFVKVDWGDGTINYSDRHTYNTTGVKTISLYSKQLNYADGYASMVGLTEVVQWGDTKWNIIGFSGATNLTLLPVSEIPDTSECLYLNTLFKNTGITVIPNGLLNRAVNLLEASHFAKNSPIDTIPDYLFANCFLLKYLNDGFLGTNITVIPANIFRMAVSLENVSGLFEFAGGITSVPEDLFYDCINLKRISNTFRGQLISTVPLKLFYYNDKLLSFSLTFEGCPITGRVPELWMRYPLGTSCFTNTSGADNASTIPDTWGGTYTGGYGKMLSAYIWEGSQADFDAQSQAWKDDPNIIHIIDGSVVGLDLRASNLAGDLTAAEKDVIKTKLSIRNGYEMIVTSNTNNSMPFIDGDFGSITINSFYTQTITVTGTVALTYTIKAVADFNFKVLKFTNTSTQTLTLNSINTNTELWEKGVLSNSISVLSGESLEMFNDGFKWRVRNRY